MAKRESLKELQTRLAQRLQQSQTSDTGLTWLAAIAGPKNYLFPLRQSGEILPAPTLRPVPRTKPWFLGVVNVRGSLFGTIDLALFDAHFHLKTPTATAGPNSSVPQTPSVVTFHHALEVNCALQVSAIAGLRSPESFASSAPAPPGSPGFFGAQFLDGESRSWQEVKLYELSRTPEFLNISA